MAHSLLFGVEINTHLFDLPDVQFPICPTQFLLTHFRLQLSVVEEHPTEAWSELPDLLNHMSPPGLRSGQPWTEDKHVDT